jgi:GGDEF domain-containing protein
MAAAASPTTLAWSSTPVMRLWRVVVTVGFALLVAHLAVGLGGHRLDTFFEQWVYDGLEVLAAVGCLLRAATTRSERAAWTVLGLGVLSFALGDICFDFVYGGDPPGVSLCDAFYLAFYPACYAALALLVRERISTFNRSIWLDGLIAALAAAAVSASVVLQVVLDHTSGDTPAMAVGLAYPVADLVLLAIVIFVFAFAGWRAGRAWTAAAVAFGVITVADSLFLYLNAVGGYQEGTLLDALWPAAMLLLAVAAWQPVGRGHAVELEGRFLAATPLACGIVALAVLAESRFHRHNLLADALAAAAIFTVLIRTALSFAENGELLATTRVQSLTDALTGLGNRRSLTIALERALVTAEQTVFVIFDLNGFKRYNDTFGHPSGDALLARLGAALRQAAGPRGEVFRLGGDEFCILVPSGAERLERIVDAGVCALSEEGEGFHVSAEYGAVLLPDEAGGLPTSASTPRRPASTRATSRPTASCCARSPKRSRRSATTCGASPSSRWWSAHGSASPGSRSSSCGWPRSCTTSGRSRFPMRSSESPVRSPRRSGGSSGTTRSSASGSSPGRLPCARSRASSARPTSAGTAADTATASPAPRYRFPPGSSPSVTRTWP